MANNFWDGARVFITGADGFIGAWIAKSLVEAKADVFVIMRDIKTECSLDLLEVKDRVNLIHGDILDGELLKRITNEKKIQVCFHLAAQPLVEVANASPASTFESNIRGTWNLLEACRVHGVERIVVASSDKAYGEQKELPYKEDAPLLGLFPYDASKACADILARCYAGSFGLKIAVTRNANTYGGADLHFNRIVPDAIRSAVVGRPLMIRSDGTLERDYMYVKDAVRGYLMLAENLHRPGISGEAFNFGTGSPISVLELFKKISALGGANVEVRVLGRAKNEINRQYLCTDKAAKLLDWKPRYTLDEGLKETWAWYREYFLKKTA